MSQGRNSQRNRWLALALGALGAVGVVAYFVRSRPRAQDVRLHQLSDRFFDATPTEAGVQSVFEQPRAPALHRRGLRPTELFQLQPADNRKRLDPSAVTVYNPYMAFLRRWEEHPDGEYWCRTNGLGLRDDQEPQLDHPVPRVLVVGDSHTDGVFENAQHFGSELERRLRREPRLRELEVLNAGHGGQTLHHYLGSLERLSWLRPDACVVMVYGGNDFQDVLTLHYRFSNTRPPATARANAELYERATTFSAAALSQCFAAMKFFAQNPTEVDVALNAAGALSSEIVAHCERLGAKALFVYIPPVLETQPELMDLPVESLRQALELAPEDLALQGSMADRYLAGLEAMGAEYIDLRPHFKASGEPLYWKRDHHINIAAQRVIADATQAWIEGVLLDGREPRPVETRPLLANGGPSRELVLDVYEQLNPEPARESDRVVEAAAPQRNIQAAAHATAHHIAPPPPDAVSPPLAVVIRDADVGRDGAGGDFFTRVQAECAALGAPPETLRDAPASHATLESACATLDSALALRPQVVVLVFDEQTDWAELLRTSETTALAAAAQLRREGSPEFVARQAARMLVDARARCEQAGARLLIVCMPAPISVGASGAIRRALAANPELELTPASASVLGQTSRDLLGALNAAGLETLDLEPLLHATPRGGFEASCRMTTYGQGMSAGLLARRIVRAQSSAR